MSDKNYKDELEYFNAMFETQGVATSTVSDGHIIKFKRSMLQAMLDKNPDNEEFVIFIKRPDFKN